MGALIGGIYATGKLDEYEQWVRAITKLDMLTLLDISFTKGGIGRVVREAYRDGSFGPIYFIRYTTHADWNESNTSYPLYTRSEDNGFVAACDALLADRLMTLQWWDEDRGLDGFYSIKRAGQALCFYHRKDGHIVALWKWSLCGLSVDGGKSFSDPVKVPTLTMDGAKIWGQRTPDGRYALVYNPTVHSARCGSRGRGGLPASQARRPLSGAPR